MTEGPLVPSWPLPLPCRLLVSALATRLLPCRWIAERLTFFVDPLLTPRLQDMMSEYCVQDVPHTIVAAGQHVLQGVATDTVQGTLIDDGGRERNFFFQAVVVPGRGANLFSVTEAIWKGVSTIFHPHKPGMEFDDIDPPMNQSGTDEKTGKLLCSMNVKPTKTNQPNNPTYNPPLHLIFPRFIYSHRTNLTIQQLNHSIYSILWVKIVS